MEISGSLLLGALAGFCLTKIEKIFHSNTNRLNLTISFVFLTVALSMLDKTMCPIDWTKTARQVHNHVRGLHPWPVATMELGGKCFKVHETVVVPGSGAKRCLRISKKIL